MASALRRRLLLVGSPYLFGDLLSDIPGDCYEVVKTAEEAAAKWDDGGAARWMAVVAVLDPMAVCGSPDEMVIRAAYALLSGVSLFDYIRVRHGAKTPLACLVNASHRWGPDALFAMATVQWFNGQVIDLSDLGDVPLGIRLIDWLAQGEPASAAVRDRVRDRARLVFDQLVDIERQDSRRGPHAKVDNAIAWLRLICADEFKPMDIHRHMQENAKRAASAGRTSSGHSSHRALSAPTVKLRLAHTLNVMIDIAQAFAVDPWERIDGDAHRSLFWEDPALQSARAFIAEGQQFYSFEDIDPVWHKESDRLQREKPDSPAQ
ncbi:MAG: hypothetical protein LKI34_06075 [Bifidobacterium tibiigranuli]|jgi:hypothetical protein|uniref:hypothetical protein n=1 Tax=Bifidobacterium tibiigranuli TaxID=2172043 RepID=UPI0026EF42A9|nr:hypothetical protein [Bifidobacterium tibiigranuli]MCI1673762.1 hypothetical protein [Bifidobacterium tibiigranuli]MCI1712011.1 hypothetical protein [Bifidobacterium tibiigranuli]